ncbi:MAG: tripartite tricarboxylate transporter TctB family protein [Burkholderiales bacterium]|nr:tripartite tricarboxylate transporter TctB family protein [Burkholderiales bacterium]
METPEEKSAASVKIVDAVTAIAIFLMGVVVIWDSWRLGAKWGSDGPEAGYFPFYIGLILCISSVINFWSALKNTTGDSFVNASSLKMIMSVMIPTIIYVGLIGGAGPVPGLGIYVASTIFIALFMKWLGKYAWPMTISVSVAVPVVFFLLFEVWFKVPLPKGPLEAALGLN